MSYDNSPDYGGKPMHWWEWIAAVSLFLGLPLGLILLISVQ